MGIVLLYSGISFAWTALNPTIIGLIAGMEGAALGYVPFAYWHELLASRVNNLPGDTSRPLFILAYGFPLPMTAAFIVLPIGGAIMGMIAARMGLFINKKRKTNKTKIVAFMWGLVFGFFFNMFVGFFNQ